MIKMVCIQYMYRRRKRGGWGGGNLSPFLQRQTQNIIIGIEKGDRNIFCQFQLPFQFSSDVNGKHVYNVCQQYCVWVFFLQKVHEYTPTLAEKAGLETVLDKHAIELWPRPLAFAQRWKPPEIFWVQNCEEVTLSTFL